MDDIISVAAHVRNAGRDRRRAVFCAAASGRVLLRLENERDDLSMPFDSSRQKGSAESARENLRPRSRTCGATWKSRRDSLDGIYPVSYQEHSRDMPHCKPTALTQRFEPCFAARHMDICRAVGSPFGGSSQAGQRIALVRCPGLIRTRHCDRLAVARIFVNAFRECDFGPTFAFGNLADRETTSFDAGIYTLGLVVERPNRWGEGRAWMTQRCIA